MKCKGKNAKENETYELATLIVDPLSCPSNNPSTLLFFESGTREAWSTT